MTITRGDDRSHALQARIAKSPLRYLIPDAYSVAMPRKKSVRSQFYRAARDLGNVEAVKNGGVEGLAKRDARRAVYRQTNSLTASFLRAIGLSGRRR
jgi:hypothetical protein